MSKPFVHSLKQSPLEGLWDLLGEYGEEVYSRDFDENYVAQAWEDTLNLLIEVESRIRFEEQLLNEDF